MRRIVAGVWGGMLGAAFALGLCAAQGDAAFSGAFSSAATALERGLARMWGPPRLADAHGDPGDAAAVACPSDALVVLTGGQSNAANALSDPVDGDPSRPALMMRDGVCWPLRDPVLGATGRSGSLWTAFGLKLGAALGGRPVVFINAAVSGARFDDWLDPETGLFDRMRAQLAAADALGLRPALVVWHQGESDAARPPAESAAIEADLAALMDRLFAALPLADNARLLLFQASRCAGLAPDGAAAVTAAQQRAASDRPRVILGPNTDRLGPRHRYDGCHFNARGRDAVVDAALETLAPLLPLLAQGR